MAFYAAVILLVRAFRLRIMNSESRAIQSFFLQGPDGKLEALLNRGADDATYAAVVCHPHPLFGGTFHNKVVFHAMKALNGFGFPVLRFNFRGAGLSEGKHDNGRGESDDVKVAIEWLHNEFHLPIIFCGFSFGAAVGLQAACPDERVKAVIGLGLPVSAVEGRTYDLEGLRTCRKPKLFVSGEFDQYGSSAKLEALVLSLDEPKGLTIIPGTDHFFEGRLEELKASIEGWIKKIVSHYPVII